VVNRSSPDDTFLPTCAYAIVKERGPFPVSQNRIASPLETANIVLT
jgi:hypothetical protein